MRHRTSICWMGAAVLAAALLCADVKANSTTVADVSTPGMLLMQADTLSTSNHARFLGILEKLHQEEKQLTPAQRWHLRYLDALRWVNAADNAKAIPLLHDIVDHSGDPELSARAITLLIQANFLSRDYKQAYVLADHLIADLPKLAAPLTRQAALSQIVSMMNSVGQYDLALQYARQMQAAFPSGKGRCWGNLAVTQTLLYAGKLASSSPEFKKTIDSCLAIGQVANANALRLDLASLMTDEGRMDQSIALLHRIAPSIQKSKYQFHIASLPVTLAQAYVKQGKDAEARKSALAALALIGPQSTNWIVEAANKVLYQAAKHAGNDVAALAYYEKYIAQEMKSASDTKARALAYQQVKQQVLAKKMRLNVLSKQNQILQLRQKLTDKAVETGRLYILLLLALLGFIVLWLLKLKHSQLSFRRLSRHDGLTGVFNRQHFLDEAERALSRLHKAGASVCLVMLDLDHFKQVNDNHGHAAGDRVLKRTAGTCRLELRTSDVFGRLGGEEFGILMPGCTREQGLEVASRIRRAVAAMSMELEPGRVLTISASFGLACSDHSGHALSQLFSDADVALYRAKNSGRNRVVVDDGGGNIRARPQACSPKAI